ncbi:uncharacterized protein CIMG_07508 [Coccidioides immitis RS]|uniref:Serine-threonine protein kinase 19 n=3 Tax=Coccidioides immitis TaxID=5501 RepID=J3K3J3_COCIM|nr:uncharacterized protein CIMG_07508 [Coccidioides immitis RS]EAS28762.3 hypothetical protein CIMG_07508 [Coccidioides immitis RS]KMP05867.1 hypothetical protein CIRG_05548 [Coccidioides immitis RMSCC 2394]KMU80702.1 hypothetical protein CISG_08766 [Coccidioides immitis RMSCC 3703]TPX23059.1 hypothetical protein DIZ76_014941 [Coccidioides immitis]
MPLQFTAAPSSRIRKPPSRSRSTASSPFARLRRAKPNRRLQRDSGKEDEREDRDGSGTAYSPDRLPDLGPSNHLAETSLVTTVVQAIQHVQNTIFTDMPASRPGMNSTRIAHVLNFRRSLPPVVSVAHVHVLLHPPTAVEREIAHLVHTARLRRLFIPGRGTALAGLGDCLVLVEDWEFLVRSSPSLDDSLKDKFIQLIRSNTQTSAVSAAHFTPDETSALVRAGFLVSPSSLAKITSSSINPAVALASPTDDAAVQLAPQADNQSSWSSRSFRDSTMVLSLPNLGPYLRLVSAARSQMLSLLEKSKYKEAPLSLLRDRWDGAVESQAPYAVAKRARGESSGVLPGRTKKWKELYGMNFRWALEEAIGAGLIEIFDTGCVGPGVRRL